jgi:hypothetical protein
MTRLQIRQKLRKAVLKQSFTGYHVREKLLSASMEATKNISAKKRVLAFSVKTASVGIATLSIGLATPFAFGLLTGANAAVVSNGTVRLGIRDEGNLGSGGAGLGFVPVGGDAITPGCLCEGWGVADAVSGVTGYANASIDGVRNMSVVSFVADALKAKSVVDIGRTFRVTHDYTPAAETANLYRALVTIENISSSAVNDLRYRRVMDWDIPPTEFSEFVTLKTSGASNVLFASDDGFATANPLGARSNILFTGEAKDSGPSDHGALFDFGFGALAAGASRSFEIFYGAAPDEAKALAALTAVAADQVYSLGQPNTRGGATEGIPNTYIFAFKGVGETPTEPVPEPLTILGTLAAGSIGVALRRKAKQQQKNTVEI